MSRTNAAGADEERSHRKESARGRLSRVVSLPAEVDADACEARVENGVVKISMPKAGESKAKRIRIQP